MKILAFVFLMATQWTAAAQIKIALFPNPIVDTESVQNEFLQRINRAGYTHIMLHAEPSFFVRSEWTNGVYQCSINPQKCYMKALLYRNFLRIGEWNKQNNGNLKVIVHLGLGNKWASVYQVFNPGIKFHVFKDYQGTDKAMKEFGLGFFADKTATGDKCPIYTNNPEYDKTVSNLVKLILQAYRDAHLAGSSTLPERMDYIHLGFDESYTESGNSYGLSKLEKLCFGNSSDDVFEMNRQYFANQGISANLSICYERWKTGTVPQTDDGKCTKWISSWDNNQVALIWRHKLLSDEIEQQINAIKSASSTISGDPLLNAKFMLWGDIWDPQKAGGYFGFSQFIGDLYTRFGQSIVMLPWQYTTSYQSPVEAGVDVDIKFESGTEIGGQIRGSYNTTGHYYDSKAALEAFTSKNIPVVFCGALRAGNGKIDYSSVLQAYNYSMACKENVKCLGYTAGIYGTATTAGKYDFAKGAYEQGAAYSIIELLSVVESKTLKGVTINETLGNVRTAPGYLKAPGLFQFNANSSIMSLLAQ